MTETLEISRKAYPATGHEEIDRKIEEAFEGTRVADSDDTAELVAWAKDTLKLDVDPEKLNYPPFWARTSEPLARSAR